MMIMVGNATVRRPGPVTFVGVLLYINALVAAVGAAAAFYVLATGGAFQAGRTTTELWSAGIIEVCGALILLLAASRIMNANQGARTFVAVVMGIRLASLAWLMLTHHTGYQWNSAIATAMTLVILWALYGNDASEAYFGN